MTAEEAMLAFMARPGYQPMRLEALADAIGANKDEVRNKFVIEGNFATDFIDKCCCAIRHAHTYYTFAALRFKGSHLICS